MKVLAIIPARGGSKGVKNKNIRLVAGEPLIAYAIESARESQLLTRFVVSTDSPHIAAIASDRRCPVLIRPPELALDDTPIAPVMKQVLGVCQEQFKEQYDILVLLQPTSPIRSGKDIDAVIRMFDDKRTDAVVSVVAMHDIHPARMYRLSLDNELLPLDQRFEASRRQDIEPVYYRNGAIYAIRKETFLAKETLMVPNKKAYIMPLEQLVNIDDERDLAVAEVLVKLWKNAR